ncbi:MAG: potassium-transporting ATPase subunit KdpC [Phycisphaerales bacterium]|nr:potassium-transporting ATPase subunit KdpC [Phycisphaerales bacterium]
MAVSASQAASPAAGLLRPALVLFGLLSLTTGMIYPLVVTGIAQVAFRDRANGSIITRDGEAIGSRLVGQDFSQGLNSGKYFWGRLSATGPVPYTAFNAETLTGSSGSNLAPTNPALLDNASVRLQALRAADAAAGYQRPAGQLVPVDLVTASGSGLDPHISPAAAEYQLPRVARARGMSEESVRELVHRCTEGRTLGVLGEPCVNVLELDLALDAAAAR